MLFAWLSQELYTITLFDFLLRGAIIVLIAALFINYRRQNRQLSKELRYKSAFLQLGHGLSSAQTAQQAAEIIVETAQELFGWDAATLKLYDRETGEVESIINYDTIEGRLQKVAPPPPEQLVSPMMARVLEEGPQLILRTKAEM
ncbi:MAG: hypothetical protein ACK4UN_06425, partial [Limisphaerales bacterium]